MDIKDEEPSGREDEDSPKSGDKTPTGNEDFWRFGFRIIHRLVVIRKGNLPYLRKARIRKIDPDEVLCEHERTKAELHKWAGMLYPET